MAGRGLRESDAGVKAGPRRETSAASIPLSLYVHIPWCVRKCPYCDFNSHALRGPIDQAAYVDALLHDLDQEAERQALPPIQSVFIGGGTPSLLDGAAIGRLLAGIDRRLALTPQVEITLEANPGTAEAVRFRDYRAAGVNRLSIGVQSLDDAALQALGRIHGAAEAAAAYRMARAAGFDNVNLDLMYGLPQQRPEAALEDLQRVIALAPEHLSWYQLTLEPNTLFHRRPPPLPDDDALADIMEAGQALLDQAGYRRYEISAYAVGGRQCLHNLNYWRFGDYLGIGAGAHGKLTRPGGSVVRRSKRRGPADYLAAVDLVAREHRVRGGELAAEFFLNAMRLADGVEAKLFPAHTGLPLATVALPLVRARGLGLMTDDDHRLQPTPLGQRFLNDLLALFEPD